MIKIKLEHLSAAEICDYLTSNDKNFSPPLSGRINIGSYSLKLNEFATHFCLYEQNRLIGFAACYFNDVLKETAFISSFSICKDFQSKGFSSQLLDFIIEYGVSKKYRKVSLRVRKNNTNAIKLYQKSGFIQDSVDASLDSYIMTKTL